MHSPFSGCWPTGRRNDVRSWFLATKSSSWSVIPYVNGVADADRQRVSALQMCLERLPPRQRQLIRDRYAVTVSVNALAAQLGCTANQISARLYRIRQALAKCVEAGLRKRWGHEFRGTTSSWNCSTAYWMAPHPMRSGNVSRSSLEERPELTAEFVEQLRMHSSAPVEERSSQLARFSQIEASARHRESHRVDPCLSSAAGWRWGDRGDLLVACGAGIWPVFAVGRSSHFSDCGRRPGPRRGMG